MQRLRPTLGFLFVLANICLASLLGALLVLLYRGSRDSLIDTSAELLDSTSALSADRVATYLDRAQRPIADIESQIKHDLFRASSTPAPAVESHLFAELLADPGLAEVTFTHASSLGWEEGDAGAMKTTPEGRWQVSVFRQGPEESSPILSRTTRSDARRFLSELRPLAGGDPAAPPVVERSVPDPTDHPTFATLVRHDHYGETLWSDLSFSELDALLPEPRRRVVVTVMKALEGADGHFVGVVRVGLRTERVAAIVQEVEAAQKKTAPLQLFLCDDQGRLVTPLAAGDRLVEQSDTALRYSPTSLPPELARALTLPALRDTTKPARVVRFEEGERPYLVAYRDLPGSQGWRVGVLAAEGDLPAVQKLQKTRNRLGLEAAGLMALMLAGGIVVLRVVRRGLGTIVRSTSRMRDFNFAPSSETSPLGDVAGAIESLELAKTALRAMSRYVPTDLVRLLYKTGREPVLGGELAVVTMMFTDIESFTTLSERVSPDVLARILGRYLEVMTTTIHAHQGTIDKYIGDAVMAVWNTPLPCPDHPRKACQAALDCVVATEALFASAEWKDMPTLVTRFGVHTDQVMVGHFGAPDRMSFTCLGDGVNLASRLEGLNKYYGTSIIVSDAVHEACLDEFTFRLLDVVAVKGKQQGARVYELLGPAGHSGPTVDAARQYERAFALYVQREFRGALALVGAQTEGPSIVLADRCRRYIEKPPPADWDGTHIAVSK